MYYLWLSPGNLYLLPGWDNKYFSKCLGRSFEHVAVAKSTIFLSETTDRPVGRVARFAIHVPIPPPMFVIVNKVNVCLRTKSNVRGFTEQENKPGNPAHKGSFVKFTVFMQVNFVTLSPFWFWDKMTHEQIKTYLSLLKLQFRYKINKIIDFKCSICTSTPACRLEIKHGATNLNNLWYCFYIMMLNY